MSNSLIPLPADLPENWEFDNIIAPNGSDIGMPVQYGYNYVMQQLNNTQKALNGFSGDIGKDYQSLLAALALRYSKEEVDALLSQHNLAEASHPYILSLLANKVDKESPVKYDLPLETGFRCNEDTYYYIDQFGKVHIEGTIQKSARELANLEVIATLPPGFRPSGELLTRPANYWPTLVGGLVSIKPTGEICTRIEKTGLTSVWFQLSYYM